MCEIDFDAKLEPNSPPYADATPLCGSSGTKRTSGARVLCTGVVPVRNGPLAASISCSKSRVVLEPISSRHHAEAHPCYVQVEESWQAMARCFITTLQRCSFFRRRQRSEECELWSIIKCKSLCCMETSSAIPCTNHLTTPLGKGAVVRSCRMPDLDRNCPMRNPLVCAKESPAERQRRRKNDMSIDKLVHTLASRHVIPLRHSWSLGDEHNYWLVSPSFTTVPGLRGIYLSSIRFSPPASSPRPSMFNSLE
jgi:hypothetical protein